MATCQSETVNGVPQEPGNKPVRTHDVLPFAPVPTKATMASLWGVPIISEYSDGWREGEQRAIVFLNTMLNAGLIGSLPHALADVTADQIRRGTPTDGDKGGILGFWETIG